MHYVKQFKINGVDTKQVACIELQGAPNAATEGAVGVLGMDMTSPTHEVYRCVAVNGSVYTWELLSAGMSIICANITGEGGLTKSFPYSNLLVPNNYIIKCGDLILDSDGFLYQITAIGSDACDTKFCDLHLSGGGVNQDSRLTVKDGKLQLVTLNGAILSEVDYQKPDGKTIYRDSTTGEITAIGVKSIDGTNLTFFVGTQKLYDSLTDKQKENLFALITDDTWRADIDNEIVNIKNGRTIVGSSKTIWRKDLIRGADLDNETTEGQYYVSSNENFEYVNLPEEGASGFLTVITRGNKVYAQILLDPDRKILYIRRYEINTETLEYEWRAWKKIVSSEEIKVLHPDSVLKIIGESAVTSVEIDLEDSCTYVIHIRTDLGGGLTLTFTLYVDSISKSVSANCGQMCLVYDPIEKKLYFMKYVLTTENGGLFNETTNGDYVLKPMDNCLIFVEKIAHSG